MYTFHENNFAEEKIELANWSQATYIDLFDGTVGTKQYVVSSWSVKYLAICMWGEVQIDCDLTWEYAQADIVVLVVGASDVKNHLRVTASLLSSETIVNVTIISLLWNKANVDIQGSVVIPKNVSKVEGYLHEDVVMLWKQIRVHTLPHLDVASNDVKAAHGAKVHKIDPLQLFYMNAKGISSNAAIHMIVDWYINTAFQSLSDDENTSKLKSDIKQRLVF